MALWVKFRADVWDKCFVSQVHDGDGVTIQTATGNSVVRLYGIDAPEMNQRHGRAARSALVAIAERKVFTFERHERDKYGRLIADLQGPDPGRLSVAMVRAGWAWWFKRFAFKDTELQEAEEHARAARLGLWQDPDPVPPWNWRKRKARIPG